MKKIYRDTVTNSFDPAGTPVATIETGEEVVFETLDAAGGNIRSVGDALSVFLPREKANPATGPVFVEGAEPGDTLAVSILDIDVTGTGYGRVVKNGVIIDELEPPKANLTPVRSGRIEFNDRLSFEARPMVGVIGVAPADEAVHTFYPGSHGGNMDINVCRIGSTVYLPVRVGGALLCIGDVHASMGDGELTGGGLDISAIVTVKADIHRGVSWERPLIETNAGWCTFGHGPTLAEAVRLATSDMATLLARRLDMSREEAFILIGAAVDARIGQAAELGMDATAYLEVSKEILPRAY